MTGDQARIVFRCPCGWRSDEVPPTTRGALHLICTQYHEHLDAVGYSYRRGWEVPVLSVLRPQAQDAVAGTDLD